MEVGVETVRETAAAAAESVAAQAQVMQSLLGLAGQIYCARAGEAVVDGRANRTYDHQDAVSDAAAILTLTFNAAHVEKALAAAAKAFGLPSIWPDVRQGPAGEDDCARKSETGGLTAALFPLRNRQRQLSLRAGSMVPV
jgi:hypothetical protein